MKYNLTGGGSEFWARPHEEKEGLTAVSSALNQFYDHLSRFWEKLDFVFFELL